MSDPMTAPDPKTVREIARDALVIAIRRGTTEAVETALIAHGVGGPVVGEKFDAYTNAVAAEYDRLAAERAQPDEQQPADVVTAEPAYPGKPGDGWQDDEGACWVLCADGKMRMLVETEEPEDPAELDARFGPMLPLDSNQEPTR